ncbi:MAG: hypothetical protein GXY01_06045 [Clostridiales bacterium]|jgi:hypothetical protein|nr:hypothetical protein [Clostridiales bacterium]
MKKIVILLSCALLVISLAACGSGKNTEAKPGDTMSLEEIFDSILKDVDGMPEVSETEVTDENYHYYLFIEPVEGAEALAADSIINAVPHSAVLLRLPEEADASKVAEDIEKNANPRKWICVGAEKTIVKAHGSTILLVMSFTDTADKIASNFDALWA